MPLPMVHLKMAVYFKKQSGIKEDLDTFYLGNIAPDSIHMRDNTTSEDKNRTHFFPSAEEDYLTRLEKLYSNYLKRSSDSAWKSFVKGYFMHVVTDYYWFQELYPKFVESNKILSPTPENLKILYYKETDQIDFNIYKNEAWREEVWNLLGKSRSFNFGDLLTSDEITRWRDRTFSFFNDSLKEPGIVPEYITNTIVNEFIEETVEHLKTLFKSWD